jgi:hypothetical protein
MKIVYFCYGGSHSSVTAAGIHLGLLPSSRIPSAKEFMGVPYYDGQVESQHGQYQFMGIDQKGNEVFIIGVENTDKIFEIIVKNTLSLFNVSPEQYLFVNSLEKVNNLMRVGGYLSRHLGLVAIGRPLVIRGTQAAYWKFVKLVEEVKKC